MTFFQFEVVCANVIMFQCRTFPLKSFSVVAKKRDCDVHRINSTHPHPFSTCSLQTSIFRSSRFSPTGRRVNFAQSKFYQQTFRREAKLNCKRHQTMLADVTSQQAAAALHGMRCANRTRVDGMQAAMCFVDFSESLSAQELQKQ